MGQSLLKEYLSTILKQKNIRKASTPIVDEAFKRQKRERVSMELNEVFHRFKVDVNEGRDKRSSLADAVLGFIHPKDFLYSGTTCNLPCGIMYEITRQFWGKGVELTIGSFGASINVMIPLSSSLFHKERIVSKIICTYAGDMYPAPSPSRIMQQLYKERRVEVQEWSLLSMVMRAFAGAQGLDFIEAKSIAGTDIAARAVADYKQIESPFTPGKKVGVVSALKPDVAVVHALVSDRYGNSMFAAPFGGYLWGVLAAKNIIVTAEKIVDTDVIRKYNDLIFIPGNRVSAVVELPFGAHPACNRGIPEIDLGYSEDYDFIVDYRKATKPNEGNDWTPLKEWLNKWVLNSNPEKYRADLGSRLDFLQNTQSKPDYWMQRTKEAYPRIDFSVNYSPGEMMTIQAAREGVEAILEKKYETILAGQGHSNLAAWLAQKICNDRNYLVELIAEIGFYGYNPRPGSPFIFNFANLPSCKQSAGILHTLGQLVNGAYSNNIGFLGAGQVDKRGNINSTLAADMYLVGSGGAADVCGGSKEVVICINHHPLRVIEEVPYITGVGDRVNTVVTTFGVLKKQDGELVLAKIFPGVKETPEKAIKYITRQTGWRLQAKDPVEMVTSPSEQELALIRFWDPNHNFLRETSL